MICCSKRCCTGPASWGESISDMRILSKSFHADPLSEGGLLQALQNEIQLQERGGKKIAFTVSGTIAPGQQDAQLMLFSIVKDIFLQVAARTGGAITALELDSKKTGLQIAVTYSATIIEWTQRQVNPGWENGLDIFEKAAFAGIRITVDPCPGNKTNIKLVLPSN